MKGARQRNPMIAAALQAGLRAVRHHRVSDRTVPVRPAEMDHPLGYPRMPS
jgi:hypothetical protein